MPLFNSSRRVALTAAIVTFSLYTNTLYTVYAKDGLLGDKGDSSRSGGLVNTVRPALTSLIKKQHDLLEKEQEKYASRAAELKTKLANFKDKTKATRVEQINKELNNVNQKQTQAMSKQLLQMTTILGKIQTKANQSTDSAKLSLVTSDVTTANDAIAAAQVIVDTQSKKQYVVQVGTEATVKADAIKERDLLKTDLKTTEQSVKSARDAVIKTYKDLGSFGGNKK